MTTYVHKDSRNDVGRHRPTSWHILREWVGSEWKAFCGRRFPDSADTMADTPNAATCESCYRNAEKARERADARWLPAPDVGEPEDDGSTQPVETVP